MKIDNKQTDHNDIYAERFADIALLRFDVPGFDTLPLSTKCYLYYLSEATLWGRDIIYSQHNRLNLKLRNLLETLYIHALAEQKEEDDYLSLREYLYQLWFASGIHHHYGERKFTPKFSETYLRLLYKKLPIPIKRKLGLTESELNELIQYIFDDTVAPIRRAHGDHNTLLERSSVNFYEPGITTKEADSFYRSIADNYPIAPGLNTKLVRDEYGELTEERYCAKNGLASKTIAKIIEALKKAKTYAPSEASKELINHLIAYYEDGDLHHFYDYSIAWIDIQEQVDFINGFIETYTDPLGLKGSWEGLVELQDDEGSKRAAIVAQHAAQWEARSPIKDIYKKGEIKGVSARAINAVMLGGDSYPASPLGINLPNDEDIRAHHGSKSVSLTNISLAVEESSQANGTIECFYRGADVVSRIEKYGTLTNMLHTDLHECLGHGSGKLKPGIKGDALGPYDSTIEETRADINTLYFMADEEMVTLGILPNNEAYKAQYDLYMTNALIVQLARLQKGEKLTEAHMQNRALIARYLVEHAPDALSLKRESDGHYYVEINDYEKLRSAMGELLALIQEIKSEGNREAARLLVEKYAVEVDPDIHQDAIDRYQSLNLAPFKGFINPRLKPIYSEKEKQIIDIKIDYDESYEEQMLRYSRDYSVLHKKGQDDKWQDTLAKIRRECLIMMDGTVAQSMRDKGVTYYINYGVTLLRIRTIAKKLPVNKELAQLLWSKDVREFKILSTMIWPKSSLTQAEAMELALSSPYIEVSEQLCINLLMHQPYVEDLTVQLWQSSRTREQQSDDKAMQANIIPYILMTRMMMTETKGKSLINTFLKNAATDLKNEETTQRSLYILRGIEKFSERDSLAKEVVKSFTLQLSADWQ